MRLMLLPTKYFTRSPTVEEVEFWLSGSICRRCHHYVRCSSSALTLLFVQVLLSMRLIDAANANSTSLPILLLTWCFACALVRLFGKKFGISLLAVKHVLNPVDNPLRLRASHWAENLDDLGCRLFVRIRTGPKRMTAFPDSRHKQPSSTEPSRKVLAAAITSVTLGAMRLMLLPTK